eukprot:14891530-Heterocapsa_arctica.AAC.1
MFFIFGWPWKDGHVGWPRKDGHIRLATIVLPSFEPSFEPTSKGHGCCPDFGRGCARPLPR